MLRTRLLPGLVLLGLSLLPALSAAQKPATLVAPAPAVEFAVIGDTGTADAAQFAVAHQMADAYNRSPYSFVLMLGDNLYSGSWKQINGAFSEPYKPLLDAGVKFYATLGNHDQSTASQQIAFPPFNMGGRRNYSFTPAGSLVEFFTIDTSLVVQNKDFAQLEWLDKALAASTARWKIVFFHHPPVSPGSRHGDNPTLEKNLVPILERRGVQVALSGHEHFFAQMAPEGGVNYLISGSGGKIQRKAIRPDPRTVYGNDAVHQFVRVKLTMDAFEFRVISEDGTVLHTGSIPFEQAAAAGASR
jgi:predicted phosphodiesterase